MAVPQQKIREIVFQLLYSYDLGQANDEDMITMLSAELAVSKQIVSVAQNRVKEIRAKQNEIDAQITKTSTSYEFDRIQSVERNILRLGVFELLFDEEIPPKVAIAEAIRLARKFGTPESASFVNAILDSLYKESLGESVDIHQLTQIAKQLKESEENIQIPPEEDLTDDVQDDLAKDITNE